MAWEFKVYQPGSAVDDVLLRATVQGWGEVHTMARMLSVVANTPDIVLGNKPPNMTAGVFDDEGNEVVSLGGRNSWDVPEEAPEPQRQPRMRM